MFRRSALLDDPAGLQHVSGRIFVAVVLGVGQRHDGERTFLRQRWLAFYEHGIGVGILGLGSLLRFVVRGGGWLFLLTAWAARVAAIDAGPSAASAGALARKVRRLREGMASLVGLISSAITGRDIVEEKFIEVQVTPAGGGFIHEAEPDFRAGKGRRSVKTASHLLVVRTGGGEEHDVHLPHSRFPRAFSFSSRRRRGSWHKDGPP